MRSPSLISISVHVVWSVSSEILCPPDSFLWSLFLNIRIIIPIWGSLTNMFMSQKVFPKPFLSGSEGLFFWADLFTLLFIYLWHIQILMTNCKTWHSVVNLFCPRDIYILSGRIASLWSVRSGCINKTDLSCLITSKLFSLTGAIFTDNGLLPHYFHVI